MFRTVLRWFAALAVALATVPVAPVGAMAQEPTPPAVTWAVQPANQDGPDGRRWIELTLDPGQVVTEHLAVRNFSDRPIVFSLQAADGYLTDRGRFNMLPSDRVSVDGGTWIALPDTVSVGAAEMAVVPFTITVPPDATPGDHPAGVAATVTSQDGTVAVESRVGFRVMMQVSGEITAALTIHDLSATYQHSWNPFAAGTMRISYTTGNGGNIAVTGIGQVTTTGPFGLGERHVRTEFDEVFPAGQQEVDTRVAGAWAWGPLRTSVEVTPALDEDGPAGVAVQPDTAMVTVWAVPWPQLALAAVLAAFVLGLRVAARRRRRRRARRVTRPRSGATGPPAS